MDNVLLERCQQLILDWDRHATNLMSQLPPRWIEAETYLRCAEELSGVIKAMLEEKIATILGKINDGAMVG